MNQFEFRRTSGVRVLALLLSLGFLTSCSGSSDSGTASSGGSGATDSPTQIVDINITDFQNRIAIGETFSCALTDVGNVYCWGRNSYGVLTNVVGNGQVSSSPVHLTVLGSGNKSIAAGAFHVCVVTSSNGVKCWGRNNLGMLGNGTTTDSALPVNVSGLASGVTALSAHYERTCALLQNGQVNCWGGNLLGNDTGNNSTTPVSVIASETGLNFTSASAVSTGYSVSCILGSGGSTNCWGNNAEGYVGDNTLTRRRSTVSIAALSSGVGAISSGFFHTCAAISGGALKCWGDNSSGQLGDGTSTVRTAPIDVVGIASAVSVGAGMGHSCAVLDGGSIYCWGGNSSGMLGDGTTSNRLTPVAVNNISNAKVVASQKFHNCAVLETGGVRCWGYNGDGQLGNGTFGGTSTSPVTVVGLNLK